MAHERYRVRPKGGVAADGSLDFWYTARAIGLPGSAPPPKAPPPRTTKPRGGAHPKNPSYVLPECDTVRAGAGAGRGQVGGRGSGRIVDAHLCGQALTWG
eukprot:COSAG01_NODE_1241_length_11085_cov_9.712361_18_plen_100_part_00